MSSLYLVYFAGGYRSEDLSLRKEWRTPSEEKRWVRSANNGRLLCFSHLKWRNRCGRNILDCPTVPYRQYARDVGIKFLSLICHLRFIFVTRTLKIILLASSNLGTFTLIPEICRSFGFFSYDWRYKDSKRIYFSEIRLRAFTRTHTSMCIFKCIVYCMLWENLLIAIDIILS
jgi:hypothetical protein